jgi:serine/threonine protein kinase/WD40 repeat protein
MSDDRTPGQGILGTSAAISEQLGEYRVLREIGRGGMGVVYEAEHQTLQRHVALKLLTHEQARNPSSLQRFLREAQAAGRLHHSNIVPVFEVGVHAGLHYYAMQYIRGQNLDTVIDQLRCRNAVGAAETLDTTGPLGADQAIVEQDLSRTLAHEHLAGTVSEPALDRLSPLPPTSPQADLTADAASIAAHDFQQIARVGLQVAEALDYAHRQGVLHRDIKPANLILDSAGTVWITDFGLAKHEGDDFTHTGDIVGTLRYMAPERLCGRGDARSDVYSLGLTLYELCTLQPAVAGHDRVSLVRHIEQSQPPAPSEVVPEIPLDLETIILKSIDKLPEHRYRSAAELAKDLRLFLADRPILARRSSWSERVWRWCRRNPVPAVLTMCVAALLIALAIGSLLFAISSGQQARKLTVEKRRAEAAEQEAILAKEQAIRRLYESCLGQARAERWSARPGQHYQTIASLAQAAEILPTLELTKDETWRRRLVLRNEAIAAMPLIDVRQARWWGLASGWTCAVAFTPDYARYAQSDAKGNVVIRQVHDDSPIGRFSSPGQRAWVLMFSPDGRYLAGKFHRGTPQPTPPMIRVWDCSTRRPVLALDNVLLSATMTFRPDSGQLALAGPGRQISLYDLPGGTLKQRLEISREPSDLCYEPSGRRLAISFLDSSRVELWDGISDRLETVVQVGGVSSLAWSPDGQILALGIANGNLLLYRLESTPRRLQSLEGHQTKVVQLIFNHRGNLLVSRSWDGTTRFWQVATGLQALQVEASLPVLGGFRADDQQLVFVLGEVGFGIWDVATGGPLQVLAEDTDVRGRWSVRFHPTQPQLLASATGRGVELWDAQAGTRVHTMAAPAAMSAVFQPEGQTLLTSSSHGLQRWPIQVPAEAGRPLRVGEPETLLASNCERIDLDAGGRWLAIDTGPERASLLALARADKPIPLAEHQHLDRVAISPDGRWLVTSTWKGLGIRLWDVQHRKYVCDLAPEVGSATPAFSPDGRWLAVSDGSFYLLWEVDRWKLVHKILREHPDGWPGPVAFSHDSRLLAVPHTRYVAQLIDPQSGRTLGVLEPTTSKSLSDHAFSPDGRYLATSEAENIQIWDLTAIRQRLQQLKIGWDFGDRELAD